MNRQVILIMTDTTRKDMLGCYGDQRMHTPYLDKLAQKGIRYEKAYCTQPVCGPARSSIFTGLSPHSNGVMANSMPLGDNIKTIGQRLSDQNVECAYIGKWHLDGSDYFGNGICPEGWNKDYWYDMRRYMEEMSEEDRRRSRKITTSFEELPEGFTYAEKCTNKAIRYLQSRQEQDDFLLVVSYDEPHGPSLCPAPYNHMYDELEVLPNPNLVDDLENKPDFQKRWGAPNKDKTLKEMQVLSLKQRMLYACNSFVDEQIGKVIECVERKFPQALIIFTSDHGDALGAHRLTAKGPSVYDEICNIPLIITSAETMPRVITSPVSHLNIVPTILEWFDKKVPVSLEGKSLKQQILGITDNINDEIYIEFNRYEVDHDGFGGFQPMRGIITEDYKMAVNLLDSDELYDTKNDPNELQNHILDEDYVTIRNELHDKILAHMNETRDPLRGYYWKERTYRKKMDGTGWACDGYTRQRENEEYEPRQLDYSTGLPMLKAVRKK